MNTFPECLKIQLPLLKKETLEKPKDWVFLWEVLASQGAAILLESAGPVNDASRWVILAGNPELEFYEKDGKAWLKEDGGIHSASFDVFDFLDQVGSHGFLSEEENPSSPKVSGMSARSTDSTFLPFPLCLSGAWFGIFSYEFGQSFNQRPFEAIHSLNRGVPDFYFFKPKTILAFDRVSKEIFYFGENSIEKSSERTENHGAFRVYSLEAQSSLENYKSMVGKVKNYIGQGDIYQANIAQAFQARWEGNSASLYRLLKEMNPGPFMGVFQGVNFTVVSSSPERLATGQGSWLETRPIAGTRPRGKDEVQDLQLQWELKTNIKEQAEHLMLVDLARNDLGRIADYGSVKVKEFARVESYAKVHHLVSVIQAKKKAWVGISEVLKSIFPAGTITGCPKVRCMEIIEETEKRARGYYTGSMGYVAPGPSFDLNILIRSFTLFPDGFLEFCAGAGIVADSHPEKEYLETLYKVEALAQALGTSFLTSR